MLKHTSFTGTSHYGSMGEHLVSHWIDMFAGAAHPGTTHGQQVGVAALAIARLQCQVLDLDRPPRVKPTEISERDFIARYGARLGPLCFAEASKKVLGPQEADSFYAKLQALWPDLRAELKAYAREPAEMKAALVAAGGPVMAMELGLSRQVWRKAMKGARDIRNRWSFLDLADDAGLLDSFLNSDEQ
jgi:glycerol-1-phosphate dehydrogenase [NAD(P)+]